MAKTIFTMVSAEAFAPRRYKSNRFAKMTLEELADDITAQNDIVEANQAEVAVDQIQEAIEEGVEVADELQEQVDQQEQLIEEAPEQVTEEVVEVAQEAFAYQMGRLQMSYEQFREHKVTVENYGSTPIAKLKVTSEGIKEVIVQIWEKIKAFFKTIWGWVKKLFSSKSKVIENTADQIDDILDKLLEDKLITQNLNVNSQDMKDKVEALAKEIAEKYKNLVILYAKFNVDPIKQRKAALNVLNSIDSFADKLENKKGTPFDGSSGDEAARINRTIEVALKHAKMGAVSIKKGFLLFASNTSAVGYIEQEISEFDSSKTNLSGFKMSFGNFQIAAGSSQNGKMLKGKIDNVFTTPFENLIKEEAKSFSEKDLIDFGIDIIKAKLDLSKTKDMVNEIRSKIGSFKAIDSKVSKLESTVNNAIEKAKTQNASNAQSTAQANLEAKIYQGAGNAYIAIVKGAIDYLADSLNLTRFVLSKITTEVSNTRGSLTRTSNTTANENK